eukprot:6552231-Prorocentrum_lima.AAC.1
MLVNPPDPDVELVDVALNHAHVLVPPSGSIWTRYGAHSSIQVDACTKSMNIWSAIPATSLLTA